ncbi:hypothetical protein [Ferruginibacter profundus]
MKVIILTLVCMISFCSCNAQDIQTINNQKIITNDMIFYSPFEFKKDNGDTT